MRRFFIATIVLVFGVVAVFAIYVAANCRDAEPPHDDHVRIPIVELKNPGKGALGHLERAMEAVAEDEEEYRSKLLSAELPWDQQLAEKIVSENTAAIEHFELALRDGHLIVPATLSIKDMDSSFYLWGRISNVVNLRTEVFSRSGEFDRALTESFKVLEFARMIQQAENGNLINNIQGIGIERSALEQLTKIISAAPLNAQNAKDLSKSLQQYRSDGDAFSRMWAMEYEFYVGFIDDTLEGLGNYPNRFLATVLPLGYRFQPNRTRSLIVEVYQQHRENSGRLCNDYAIVLPVEDREPTFWTHLTVPNSLGRWMAAETEYLSMFHMNNCSMNAKLSAVQALAGVRAFYLENGNLPNSLNELVPEFLASIPIDGFTGDPISYSRERMMIFSAGFDSMTNNEPLEIRRERLLQPNIQIEFGGSSALNP